MESGRLMKEQAVPISIFGSESLDARSRMEMWVDEEIRQPRTSIGRAISASARSESRVVSSSDDKENVVPRGEVLGWSASRSPLPSWYPRLPLQDITALMNAFQDMQLECEKKRPKPKLNVGNASVPAPSSGMIRSGCTKPRMARAALPVSHHLVPVHKNSVLRKQFR